MGFTTVVDMNAEKNYTPKKYVRYTTPTDEDGEERELKENELKLKKNDSVEGYYGGSYTTEGKFGAKYNHILLLKENTQIIIPDNKDVTKAFLSDKMEVGALTRFTYLGKTSFEYKKDDGTTGQAKAAKALVEQNKDDTVTIEGSEGCELIAGLAAPIIPNKTPDTTITASDVPF